VFAHQAVYKKHNKTLPDDPWEQLRMGIDAVFRCARLCVGFVAAGSGFFTALSQLLAGALR
jgi:hypothetical protein